MEDFDNNQNDEVVSQDVEHQEHDTNEPVNRRDTIAAAFEEAAKEEGNATNDNQKESTSASGSTDHAAAQGSSDDQQTETQQTENVVKAPASFSPQMREEFKQLSPAMQAQINKREQDWDNHLRSTNDERQFVKNIMDTMEPYREHLVASNLHPATVMKDLLGQVYTMRVGSAEQKAQVVSNIIKGYGVDINTLAKMLDGTTTQSQSAPANDQYMQEIQAIKQQLAQRTAQENQVRQQQQNAEQQKYANEVQAFMNDPKNEFFGDVHPIMQSLLANGQAQTLQDAYERAIWAHPDVRQLLQQRQQADAQKKQMDAQRSKASSSITGGGPRQGAKQQQKQVSRRDYIESLVKAAQDDKKV